jgi:hypothetical protein
MRLPLAASIFFLGTLCSEAGTLPATVEVTVEPQKFGDVASILKVDSTVASFRFDKPVSHLALVLEARPKEPRTVHVARLALDLTKPVQEGRFCVQMADQGFLPMGNGAPHQMQLFMQIDCGGTLISSSQSFLKEKFNFSRSLTRTGAGTVTRKVAGHRAPVFWLMGNSDSGTYFNDDDLDKMVARNRDAYVLIAYLEVAKPPVIAEEPGPSTPPTAPAPVSAFMGPPYPVPTKEEIKPAGTAKTAVTKSGKSSKSSSSPKKKRGS